MGLRTLDLPFPSSIQDVARGMTLVARALGDERRALPWKARLPYSGRSAPATRDAIFLGAGGNSVGVQSVEAEWMRIAGLRQPSAGGAPVLRCWRYGPPAVCCAQPIGETKDRSGQTWLEHPLASPRMSKIIPVDGRPWTCAGPLMLGEVQRLQGLM
jgi:iron complex transport system substrate-binding protein